MDTSLRGYERLSERFFLFGLAYFAPNEECPLPPADFHPDFMPLKKITSVYPLFFKFVVFLVCFFYSKNL